jgi:hypothetical protein
MDGFHVEGVPEDELDAVLGAEVGSPVPAEEAFDGDDEPLAVGLEDAQELLAVPGELLVDDGLSGLVEDADVEAAGVEADTAGMDVLFV